MAENRCRRGAPRSSVIGEEEVTLVKDDVGMSESSEELELDVQRLNLRQRWELASVLNFLSVFEPVIGSGLKMSAEDVEMALIKSDASLAKLHVALLKGIPPVSKTLSNSDTWVTILCKKLAMWWPWVAEGEVPLTAAKGEEILQYKKLDPTTRLLMLKALCEVRAEQEDSVSFINDAVKQGTQPSSFRKDKIGGDGHGISYWYDGNSVIGYRLYKEVNKSELQPKHKGRACLDPPSAQWETLATNLEEFRKVLGELSSRNIGAEVSICRTIEADAIPVLEELQKKKERALKRQQREESLLNGYHSYRPVATRSCRARRPVNYTFDEYDRTIDEAIQLTKKGKATRKRRHDRKHEECENENAVASNEDMNAGSLPEEGSTDFTDDDTESDKPDEGTDDYEDDDDDDVSENANEKDGDSDMSDFDTGVENPAKSNYANLTSHGKTNDVTANAVKLHKTKSLASVTGHPIARTRNPGTKNRLRQRPTRNTAIELDIVPDSDDGSSSNDESGNIVGHENTSVAADSEEEIDS
ncbi:hypothetical protein Ancab_002253 [Ancistrocladus abbreviatus]